MRLIGKLLTAIFAVIAISGPAMAGKYSKLSAPVTDPRSWITPEDYPPDALRAGREGRVAMAVRIDQFGRVVSCAVTTSSNTPSLDAKTCELITRRGQFKAATNSEGLPIASTYKMAFAWHIPDQPDSGELQAVSPNADLPMVSETEYVVGTDGTVKTCRVIDKSENVDNPCKDYSPGVLIGPGYKQNGKPVEAIVRRRFEQTTRFLAPTP